MVDIEKVLQLESQILDRVFVLIEYLALLRGSFFMHFVCFLTFPLWINHHLFIFRTSHIFSFTDEYAFQLFKMEILVHHFAVFNNPYNWRIKILPFPVRI